MIIDLSLDSVIVPIRFRIKMGSVLKEILLCYWKKWVNFPLILEKTFAWWGNIYWLMGLSVKNLKWRNSWVSLWIINYVGRTLCLMLLSKCQEDWKWLSHQGITRIKEVCSLYVIFLYPYLSYSKCVWGTYIQIIWDSYLLCWITCWKLLLASCQWRLQFYYMNPWGSLNLMTPANSCPFIC